MISEDRISGDDVPSAGHREVSAAGTSGIRAERRGQPDRKPGPTGDFLLGIAGFLLPVFFQLGIGAMAMDEFGPEGMDREPHWGYASAPLLYAVPMILLGWRHVLFRCAAIVSCFALFLLNAGCVGVLPPW